MYNKEDLIKEIAKEIDAKNGKIYYVGGYVRDKKIGIPNKDIDVEIYGLSFDEISAILSKFGNIDLVGASFGIYKIAGVDIDFCFPRRETLVGKGHKDFAVTVDPYISTEDAAKRRDFTINSIMQDVNTGEFIDNFDGIGDLERKVIKHIDDKTFIEDPLRVLRACQFSARLGFDIDKDTIDLCKKISIDSLPKERIYEEIKKGILKSNKPSIFMQRLNQMEKVQSIFPGIHIEEQKLNQLCEILDNSAKIKHHSNNSEYFMFASLVYGLKKMDDTLEIKDILESLTNQKDFIDSILNLTTNQLKLDNYKKNGKDISDYELRKLAISCKDKHNIFNIDDLVLLNKSIENEPTSDLLEKRINQIGLNKQRTIEPRYTGKDLIKFGIPTGKGYKKILDDLFELQLQGENEETIDKYLYSVAKNEIIKSVANDIHKNGGHCYLFGGYVRDKIIGKTPNDMDVQVIGVSNQMLEKILQKYGETIVVGKSFPIMKMKTGIDIDFLTPEDSNGNLLTVEDVQRRIDFTMNTVFEDIVTGQMIDNFGGINDIKNKCIRMTDKQTFSNDKVRSLRACRFASELGFSISPDTIEECKKFNFDDVSKSRIYEEVKKCLLRSSNPSVFFNNANKMGLVKKLFTPMDKMKGLEQEPKYHPEGDVWNHTMKVLDYAASFRDKAQDKLTFMFSALCHDFGKISTTAIDEDATGKRKITSYGHDTATEESTYFMNEIGVPKKVIPNVIALQKTHMRPNVLYKDNCKMSTIKKLVDDSKNQLNDLLLLSDSDRLGSRLEVTQDDLEYICNRRNWWNQKQQILQEQKEKNPSQTISGKELIELGFQPGPLFKEIQEDCRQLFCDNKSKEDVIKYVMEKYGKSFGIKDISAVTKDVLLSDVVNVFEVNHTMRTEYIKGN